MKTADVVVVVSSASVHRSRKLIEGTESLFSSVTVTERKSSGGEGGGSGTSARSKRRGDIGWPGAQTDDGKMRTNSAASRVCILHSKSGRRRVMRKHLALIRCAFGVPTGTQANRQWPLERLGKRQPGHCRSRPGAVAEEPGI
jgi:hypothetical protein